MNLLGRVDEKKEEREGPGRHRGDLERELRGLVDQLFESARSRRTATSRFTCAPQVVDDMIRFLAFEPPNDIAESCGEKANVVVERNVL